MRRSSWGDEAEETLDQPATVTERHLRSLRRRGAAAVVGTILAAAGLVFVALGIFRVETTLQRTAKEVALLRASLPDSVRAQVNALFDQATREEIRRVAMEGAEQTMDRTRTDISRLTARVRALNDSLEAVAALLDAGSVRLYLLQTAQDSLLMRVGRHEERIAQLDSASMSRDGAIQSNVTDLGRRFKAMEQVQAVQDEQLRSTRKKETLLLSAVPVFLGPYIHILGHTGR